MPIRSTILARLSKAAALVALVVIALLVKGAPLAPIATPSVAADPPVTRSDRPAPATDPNAVKIQAGDRVVLVGNTLIESDQRYGYFETFVTAKFRGKVTFRNLGWSGDTVWGESRAEFDAPAEGYRRLTESVAAAKPTVIIVGYGTNESFAGEAGLPHFIDGLNHLLDDLEKTKARMVLLSPLLEEDLGRPLPDPTEQNRRLQVYSSAIQRVAERRRCAFIVAGRWYDHPPTLTDDEMHLNEWGYSQLDMLLAQRLGLCANTAGPDDYVSRGPTNAVRLNPGPVDEADRSWQTDAADDAEILSGFAPVVVATGLPAGRYALSVDGQSVAEASSAEWATGVHIVRGPTTDAAERLHELISRKNRLFMSRWRPQNEIWLVTYPEQQRMNVGELPAFDPLIAEAERQIAAAAVPQRHTYRITPVVEKK